MCQYVVSIGHLTCSGYIFHCFYLVILDNKWCSMMADHRPSSNLVVDGWSNPAQIFTTVSTCSKNFFLNLHILSRSVDAVLNPHIGCYHAKNIVSPKQSILLTNFHRVASLASSNSIISYSSGSLGRGSPRHTKPCTEPQAELSVHNRLYNYTHTSWSLYTFVVCTSTLGLVASLLYSAYCTVCTLERSSWSTYTPSAKGWRGSISCFSQSDRQVAVQSLLHFSAIF